MNCSKALEISAQRLWSLWNRWVATSSRNVWWHFWYFSYRLHNLSAECTWLIVRCDKDIERWHWWNTYCHSFSIRRWMERVASPVLKCVATISVGDRAALMNCVDDQLHYCWPFLMKMCSALVWSLTSAIEHWNHAWDCSQTTDNRSVSSTREN